MATAKIDRSLQELVHLLYSVNQVATGGRRDAPTFGIPLTVCVPGAVICGTLVGPNSHDGRRREALEAMQRRLDMEGHLLGERGAQVARELDTQKSRRDDDQDSGVPEYVHLVSVSINGAKRIGSLRVRLCDVSAWSVDPLEYAW